MYFISITRLRLKSIFVLPAFLSSNGGIAKQLKISDGFIAGKELVDAGLVFWTITIWSGDADMKKFRNSVPHRKAMQKLPDWCCEATYAHWLQETSEMPTWEAIHERMIRYGVVSKVRKPTERHATKAFPLPRWRRIENVMTPAKGRAQ